MQIDLPAELIERLHKRVALHPNATEADVIRAALDSLDQLDQERRAIQEGINAWRAGDVEDFGEFDRQFSREHDISPDA
ncbi:MAG: hypothetical protein DWQ31_13225 [Planctomycetota bacterium]|mgnify:CR=1 FL=1|nr:MAG: hypothetical protein DWQ31_13225 [Planctomycetota bacterium]REJ87097.1 MAG: hypothetical protein DWQ35_22105 [Planctomycetota bacterium]REK26985.1 MAG: hypothetical protein DWQ42_07970 [Planctomycetota bacterium]REK47288.1 MAG: hypothetical protein DWQ46_04640 [Planctomycetota bacterium]